MRTERSLSSVSNEGLFYCFPPQIWEGDGHFSEEFASFERWTEKNLSQLSHRGVEKRRDPKGSWRQIKPIRREQDSCRTRDEHFVTPYPFTLQNLLFLCLQFVFDCHLWAFVLASRHKITLELRLLSIAAKDFDPPGDCNQDFVAPASYHIPLRGYKCQSERAPAFRGNGFWSCVLDSSRHRSSRHSIAEWEKKATFAGGRSGTVEERQRCTAEQTVWTKVWANDHH